MKIGIDVRALQNDHKYRGIGQYLYQLLMALSKIDHKNEYNLFLWAGKNSLLDLKLGKNFKYRPIHLPLKQKSVIAQKVKNIVWHDIKAKNFDINVFMQPDVAYGFPTGHFKKVAVFYDLIEFLYKEHHYPSSLLKCLRTMGPKHTLGNAIRWQLYKWQLGQYKKADLVLAISGFSKQDLIKNLAISASKIKVTPLAAGDNFKPIKNSGPILKKYHIKRPFLLYIGGADYRKNVSTLIKTFELISNLGHKIDLVLGGRNFSKTSRNIKELRPLFKQIDSSQYKKNIKLLGYVPMVESPKLYSATSAFIFPSLYEGFGIPLLEAMRCGAPVISYNNSSIPEVTGPAALLVTTDQQLEQAIIKVLTDKELAGEMVDQGYQQATKFSWAKTANETLKYIEGLVK